MSSIAPKMVFRDAQIEMAHGAGGKASRRLVEGLIAPWLLPKEAGPLADAASVKIADTDVLMTADSFVVRPLRFPGGSIGELAVNGTVNDLAVSGSRALALLVTFVLEAGLPAAVLEGEVRAISDAARRAGVSIVGGDTKVVEHGKAEGMYITTAGIGSPLPDLALAANSVLPGDKIIMSGAIADHGITILLARGELDMEADIRSDTRSVLPFVEALAATVGPAIRWMRDPTRGGVATVLNELARDAGVSVHLQEDSLPVRDAVRGACELLGLDPLHIANEGQFVGVVAPDYADAAIDVLLRAGCPEAAIIGEVYAEPRGTVLSTTPFGGTRVIDMLVGDPLPRIC